MKIIEIILSKIHKILYEILLKNNSWEKNTMKNEKIKLQLLHIFLQK